ncbi:pentapeptide repeat-containing protein, partial [Crocosphaera watsonii]|uniref:pentapeptide repeat-containing protein n=1 Tax=Crocosphaera watsonii TaxID=263511 RepID=UPI000652425A
AGAVAFAFAVALTLFACYLGYRTLKDEMRDPWLRKIVIAFAAMGGTSFYKATVTDADFTGATLKNVNFNRAILTRTCFKDTVKLNLARPGNTLLEKPIVRDLLINPSSGEEKDLSKANLRGAYLKEANLQRANLKNADISGATFEYANLSSANLTEVNAVYTNFNSAYLTGACLENWNIDTTTKLDNVDCQYVYLLNNEKERQPSSGDFKTGEFTKLFEEVFDTVNLIFENGIDWKAFIETMKTVQVENEDTPLEVSSIENKGDGVFVVKVKVPPDADKEKIHQEFEENYQLKLQAVEAKYKALLDAKENEISSYHRENANMMEITKILASRPINIETKAMNNSPDNSTNITTGDINNTGNLNIGKIIKDVNNTIDNISESDNNENEQLKTSLKELMQAIETENELDDEEKAGAANNVKTIAKASQKPEDEGLQKKATRAVKLLETLAKGLKPANKLYTACQSILPQIVTFLGITL